MTEKTALEVAEANVKEPLKPPAKRKAVEAGGGASKRAAPAKAPTLHLFEPVSSSELSDNMGEWFAGDDEPLCKEDVQHKDIKSAPESGQKIAKQLHKALDEATLPAGESDIVGLAIVISNPGKDPKEACLRALAIKEEVEDEELIYVWDEATCDDEDFSDKNKFCGDDDDEEDDEDDEDSVKIKKATKILADNLKDCFHFNFSDSIVTAPQVWGGYTKDNHIVGVLGMRVWT
eukprot:TRINITY_DN31679_c0_g1_i3.p1 TRINITY_DN31679_c0_g1~~TRINITY_DN31679_c0_g1_i3.p1  ORF type:complete len:233 (+),score=74.68 TRINITY_DN31679_c0_g1_i3:708-1406(+)